VAVVVVVVVVVVVDVVVVVVAVVFKAGNIFWTDIIMGKSREHYYCYFMAASLKYLLALHIQ